MWSMKESVLRILDRGSFSDISILAFDIKNRDYRRLLDAIATQRVQISSVCLSYFKWHKFVS